MIKGIEYPITPIMNDNINNNGIIMTDIIIVNNILIKHNISDFERKIVLRTVVFIIYQQIIQYVYISNFLNCMFDGRIKLFV